MDNGIAELAAAGIIGGAAARLVVTAWWRAQKRNHFEKFANDPDHATWYRNEDDPMNSPYELCPDDEVCAVCGKGIDRAGFHELPSEPK